MYEFFYVIGFDYGYQLLVVNIEWDEDVVYDEMVKSGWICEKIDCNIFI